MSKKETPMPQRECNGGPNATHWCGRPATSVGRRDTQLPAVEWFACELHRGDDWTPIEEWFARVGLVRPEQGLKT